MSRIDIVKGNGDKKVRIHDDGYGLELLTMRNGWQWSGAGVDDEILDLIVDAINDYKKSRA